VICVNAANAVELPQSTTAKLLLFSTIAHIAGYSADVVLVCLAEVSSESGHLLNS